VCSSDLSASAITVGTAATVTIQGPPVAAGSTTITNPLALFVANGITALGDGRVLANWAPADAALDIFAPNKFVYIDSNGASEWGLKMRGNNAGWADIFRFTAAGATGQIYCGSMNGGYFLTLWSASIEAARFDLNCNYILGATTAGATAAKCLALTNSATAPTTSADLAHLYAKDIAAGRATLAYYTEEAVAVDVGLASTHSHIIWINGTKYKLMLVAA
jgi:hypothetical protein